MRVIRNSLLFIVIILMIIGCTSNPPPKGVDDFPFELMVNIIDLTNQFEKTGSEFPKIDEVFS